MEVTKEILFDYFAGRLTALQRRQLAEWARQPLHQEWYYQCLDEWERSRLQYAAELDAPLADYRHFMAASPVLPAVAPVSPPPVVRRFSSRWLAAACLLLALAWGGWLLRDDIRYRTHATAYGETRAVRLPDGSHVVLNANTVLQVPRFGFGRAGREVRLAGEANFTVRHLPDHQRFVVHTGKGLDVLVLGTEFTVFARPRGTRVVLTKGKVRLLYAAGAKALTLRPGDMATLTARQTLAVQRVARPEAHAAWARKQFVFENTSLREVAAMLRENYGLRVEIPEPRLAAQTLTGSFSAQSADELLQALADILDIQVIRRANRIILTESKP